MLAQDAISREGNCNKLIHSDEKFEPHSRVDHSFGFIQIIVLL